MNISELFNVGDILWHVFNTVLLFVGLRIFLYKPVRKFMNQRTERLQAQQDKADGILADAEAQAQHSRELVQQANAQAAGMLSDSAQQAQASAEAILKDARAQADAIVTQARDEAQKIRQKNVDAMRDEAVTMAVEISSKILEREISASDHQEMIDDFLAKVK